MSDSISESAGEDIPGGKESDASVNERLAEMKAQAARAAGVKQQMKKQEGKVRRKEDSIIQFLIRFANSGGSDTLLLSSLNTALARNHSPYILIAGLELLYNIQDIDESYHTQLVLHTHQEALQLATWLQHLEEAGYENPERTLSNIILHPDSLSKFFEAILQTYRHLYPNAPVPLDLVEVSRNISQTLQKLLEKYIQGHSLENGKKE